MNTMTKKITRKILPLLFAVSFGFAASAQDVTAGRFSGSLQANGNFFIKDSLIGASNTPQYENKKFGSEAWLNLNYNAKDFDMGIRFDMFNNSNIVNPNGSYTGQGIGAWWIHKKVNAFDFRVGYIYDQIGSGIIYRAYEDRPLAIDNALYGAKMSYDINQDWKVKIFAGKVKTFFTSSGPSIKGGSITGFITGKEGSQWSLAPGVGFVNQTFDDETIQQITANVSTYTPADGIKLYHNTYASSAFNTFTYKNFSLYLEGAYKWHDVYRDANAPLTLWDGTVTAGKFRDNPGTVFFGSLTYAADKVGITIEGKRTENFRYRIDPFAQGNFGAINFIPPMARQNTYRLTAFYSAVTQELSEQAFQMDITYSLNKKVGLLVNGSYINDLDGNLLYREIYTEAQIKPNSSWNIVGGLQLQNYNIDVYLSHKGDPNVKTIVPYADILYKMNKTKSIRFEAQFMSTQQDRGSWAYALIEIGLAPHWIFTASDMYNLASDKIKEEKPELKNKTHYFTAGVVYNAGTNRFSLNYVKQVDGIVCSGGVCRYEPAFSGVRLNMLSNF